MHAGQILATSTLVRLPCKHFSSFPGVRAVKVFLTTIDWSDTDWVNKGSGKIAKLGIQDRYIWPNLAVP